MVPAIKHHRRIWIVLAVVVVALAGCEFPGGDGSSGQPTVNILSPPASSQVILNEAVAVQVSGMDADGDGIVRFDLMVNNVTVNTFETAGPQAEVSAELSFTPTTEGPISVSVVAYRKDGTPSVAATIALEVVPATALPPEESSETTEEDSSSSEEEESTSSEEEESSSSSSSEPRVEARANVNVNIRELPGPGCNIIGTWNAGTTGFFLVRTTSPTDYWYETDYLGENTRGYVYQGDTQQNFTLLGDDSVLPREPEEGCLFCGDGICSAEIGEACDQCTDDCGVCPFCGDGEVNQDSEECDGGGCQAGYACNASCTCEQVAECGNGVVDPGEECDSDASTCGGPLLQTCSASCTCEPLVIVPVAQCGNGIVEPGEACDPPEICAVPGQVACNINCQLSVCP